jgi:hypothetical protein
VDHAAEAPTIPESLFEHKQVFASPWLDQWVIPNPFISVLFETLRRDGVGLADFSFNKEPANFAETYLNVSIRKLNAAVRIGLDAVTYIAANPDWEMVPQLLEIFERVSERIRGVVGGHVESQEATLAFHVTPGPGDFQKSTASLLNPDIAGKALFSGISLHRSDGVLIIDKSLRYDRAAFVRLQCRFPAETQFSEVASRLHEDEISALRLLGVTGVA